MVCLRIATNYTPLILSTLVGVWFSTLGYCRKAVTLSVYHSKVTKTQQFIFQVIMYQPSRRTFKGELQKIWHCTFIKYENRLNKEHLKSKKQRPEYAELYFPWSEFKRIHYNKIIITTRVLFSSFRMLPIELQKTFYYSTG